VDEIAGATGYSMIAGTGSYSGFTSFFGELEYGGPFGFQGGFHFLDVFEQTPVTSVVDWVLTDVLQLFTNLSRLQEMSCQLFLIQNLQDS